MEGCDGLARGGPPPAHTPRGTRGMLERASARVAQPTPGMDSRSESGMTEIGGGGKRGSECSGGMGDLHLPSPDSSLPFGMTVRGVGWLWRHVTDWKMWAAPRSTLRGPQGERPRPGLPAGRPYRQGSGSGAGITGRGSMCDELRGFREGWEWERRGLWQTYMRLRSCRPVVN